MSDDQSRTDRTQPGADIIRELSAAVERLERRVSSMAHINLIMLVRVRNGVSTGGTGLPLGDQGYPERVEQAEHLFRVTRAVERIYHFTLLPFAALTSLSDEDILSLDDILGSGDENVVAAALGHRDAVARRIVTANEGREDGGTQGTCEVGTCRSPGGCTLATRCLGKEIGGASGTPVGSQS